jgi:hypothetical protein
VSKTISPDHAAALYEAEDGEFIDTWARIGNEEDDPKSRTSRWHERYWLLLRDEDGATWGLEYGVGLTEDQENDYPWEQYGTERPLPLTRLYAHEVTTIEWSTKP